MHNLIFGVLKQRSRFSFPQSILLRKYSYSKEKSNMKYKNETNVCAVVYFIMWDLF